MGTTGTFHVMSNAKTQKMVERDRNISAEEGSELLPGASVKSQKIERKKRPPPFLALYVYICIFHVIYIFEGGHETVNMAKHLIYLHENVFMKAITLCKKYTLIKIFGKIKIIHLYVTNKRH